MINKDVSNFVPQSNIWLIFLIRLSALESLSQFVLFKLAGCQERLQWGDKSTVTSTGEGEAEAVMERADSDR